MRPLEEAEIHRLAFPSYTKQNRQTIVGKFQVLHYQVSVSERASWL